MKTPPQPKIIYRPWTPENYDQLQQIHNAASEIFGDVYWPLSNQKIGMVMLRRTAKELLYRWPNKPLRLSWIADCKMYPSKLPNSAMLPLETSIGSFAISRNGRNRYDNLYINTQSNDKLLDEYRALADITPPKKEAHDPSQNLAERIVIGYLIRDPWMPQEKVDPLNDTYRSQPITLGSVKPLPINE